MSVTENNISGRLQRPQMQPNARAVKDPNHKLKQGIWIYFFLLIFEGALRKWILPGLAGPLLIIRDPLALYLIVLANQRDLIKSGYAKALITIGIISFFLAIVVGHGNVAVAAFGARILVLHLPVIFIIGKVFDSEDVIKMGKAMLWISLPMILLVVMQFFSPQSALVNRGVGGDESGAGFSGAMGFLRPPGTFSFTNGNASFFSFLAAYIFYFWLYPEKVQRWLLLASTFALIASIPISISRTLLFSIVVTGLFTLIAVSRKPAYFKRMLGASIGIIVLFFLISQLGLFGTASEVFLARFNGANDSEGGIESVLLDRYLGGMVRQLSEGLDQPFFGYGIGLGTNLGAQLLGAQSIEGEWGKILWEQGLVLGLAVIIIRVSFCVEMVKESYKRLASGHLLPWIMLSMCLLYIPQGQLKQPTSLGFSVIIAGLQLASLRVPKKVLKQRLGKIPVTQV